MHKEAVHRVPMFQCEGCDESFFNTIVRLLRVNVLLENDFVFKQGELGDRMYFIKTGYLQIGSPDRSIIFVSKGPGSYVGELTLFNPGVRRNASAWSLSDCILFTLEITDFEAVVSRYDKSVEKNLYERMKAISMAQGYTQKKINKCQQRRQSDAYTPPPVRRVSSVPDGVSAMQIDGVSPQPSPQPPQPPTPLIIQPPPPQPPEETKRRSSSFFCSSRSSSCVSNSSAPCVMRRSTAMQHGNGSVTALNANATAAESTPQRPPYPGSPLAGRGRSPSPERPLTTQHDAIALARERYAQRHASPVLRFSSNVQSITKSAVEKGIAAKRRIVASRKARVTPHRREAGNRDDDNDESATSPPRR